jgi:hypothetical protein
VQFPFPPLAVNAALAPFAAIAIAMIAVTIFVFGKALPSNGRPPLVTQMALALAVIGGGSVLLLALVFVFISSDGTSAWTFVLLAFNFMMTGPAGLWFIGLIVFQDRRLAPQDWTWPMGLAVMTTGSEVLMGCLFAVGGATAPLSLLPALASGVSSVWFFWSMAAVMTALLVWAPLARLERYALVALTLAMVLGPWVTSYPVVGGAAMTVLMVAIFGVLVRAVSQRSAIRPHEAGFLLGLAVAFLAMALAGLTLVVSGGSVAAVLVYGTVMGVVMIAEIAYLLRRFWSDSSEVPWVARTSSDDDETRERVAVPSPHT